MPSTCEFQLNKINAVYHSGETVEGTIVLTTTSPKEVTDVRIIFRGETKVSWQENEIRRSNGRSSSHTVDYKSNELYVNNCTYVRGEGILPPGTHTYTFLIQIPLECPTSCEGRYGHTRYELILQFNRPFRFDNIFSKPVTVIKSCDLNLNPAHMVPVVCEGISSSCFWPCSGGKIMSTFKTPFGGYACGQTVKYSLHIQNQSMSDVNGYSLEFCRKMSFNARTPRHNTRHDESTFYKQNYNEPCLRLTNRVFEGHFGIPSTSPTIESGVICVDYYLKVTVHVAGCSRDSDLSIPIFVGTVPLRPSLGPVEPTETSNLIQSIQPTAPQLPCDDDVMNDFVPSYKDLCPPSFEEATRSSSPFIDTDKDERNRNTGFRPLYPMYSQSDE